MAPKHQSGRLMPVFIDAVHRVVDHVPVLPAEAGRVRRAAVTLPLWHIERNNGECRVSYGLLQHLVDL
jgi:hypothetical protein